MQHGQCQFHPPPRLRRNFIKNRYAPICRQCAIHATARIEIARSRSGKPRLKRRDIAMRCDIAAPALLPDKRTPGGSKLRAFDAVSGSKTCSLNFRVCGERGVILEAVVQSSPCAFGISCVG
jgi:hypothetical protein